MTKIKIDGFRMHQEIYKQFLFLRDESFHRPSASAYTVYLTMLKQLDIEKNQRGMLKEYNLAEWSRKLSIPYSSMYSGKCYLEEMHFIKEEIHNGLPVLVLKDIEKLNNPGNMEGKGMNYLLIPHSLFETNILAEFVRTSNPEAIELMLSLFNQFRTAMSKKQDIDLTDLRQVRNMSTLKKGLNKCAKKVRQILTILEPLFSIEFEGVFSRGNGKQLWVKKVWITLKDKCVKEQSEEEFKVDHLTAMLSHELTYWLDGQKIKYKPRDTRDILLSYKQEIYDLFIIFKDNEKFNLKKTLKQYFFECMDSIGIYIYEQKIEKKSFRIYSLGAIFRQTFRRNIKSLLHQIPTDLQFDSKLDYLIKYGVEPPIALKYNI